MNFAIMVVEIQKHCFIDAVAHGFLALIPQLDWYLLLALELDVNLLKKKNKNLRIK